MPQAGAVAIPVVPTFKGFRKALNQETDTAAASSSKGFRKVFSKTGSASGRDVGAGFKKAFESSSSGFADKGRKELESAVAKSARALAKARLTEMDAAGRARVAERQLAEARAKYARDSSRVVAAEERLESANRKVREAQDRTAESTADLRDAQNKLARAAQDASGKMESAGSAGARKFDSGFKSIFSGSFLGTTVANIATSLVSRIGTAIGEGLRNAVTFAMGTIDIASDLGESVNAVEVAFGAAGQGVLTLGRDSAKQFGLSQAKFNSYAVQMSAFAQQIAGEGGNVVGTLDDIVTRATDFASVMNLDVGDSLGLIQSGLAGETEPLRKYGIDLSAAAVSAYAAANGIGESGKELTEQQKVLARYGSLMEQTAKVQGDFENTQDSFANKGRIVSATWEDMQARIGEKFMPVAERLLGLLGDKVLPVVERMIDKFGPEFSEALVATLPALEDMVEEVLPLLPDLLKSAADNLPAIISGITAVAPAVAWLAEVFGDVLDSATWLVQFLNGDLSLAEFGEKALAATGPLADFMESVAKGTADVVFAFYALPGRIQEALAGIGTWLVDSGRSLLRGFIDGINEALPWLDDAVSGVMDFVSGFFPNSPAKRGPFSGSGWTDLQRSGGAVFEEFTGGIEGAKRAVALTYPTVDAPDPVTGSRGASGAAVHVDAHFATLDPQIGVELMSQKLSSTLRKVR